MNKTQQFCHSEQLGGITLATPINSEAVEFFLFSFFFLLCYFVSIEVNVKENIQMATTAASRSSAIARGNSTHSSLGTVAPLNTPTRRFYGAHDQVQPQPPGVPNPNIYVVQPFKNASVPKDLVYSRKVSYVTIDTKTEKYCQ